MRRVHTPNLRTGEIELDPGQAHHIRDVLRLAPGTELEAFDDHGRRASATIGTCTAQRVTLQIEQIEQRPAGLQLTIASALPKGERADWMIEKLSELGVSRLIPLSTARSVVHPEGSNKRARWMRLATEAAKQSRRSGIMAIEELTPIDHAIRALRGPAYVLAPLERGSALFSELAGFNEIRLTVFVGAEGGWTEDEMERFAQAQVMAMRLTESILRIETAAVAAAALIQCAWAAHAAAIGST